MIAITFRHGAGLSASSMRSAPTKTKLTRTGGESYRIERLERGFQSRIRREAPVVSGERAGSWRSAQPQVRLEV